MIDHGLATEFTFAGVISGAGALVDINLVTDQSPPLLLFHGTQDPLVPYGIAPHHFCRPDQSGWLMLFGAGALADRLDAIGGSYSLFTHVGGGHELAGRYFHQSFGRTLEFIEGTQAGTRFRWRVVVGG